MRNQLLFVGLLMGALVWFGSASLPAPSKGNLQFKGMVMDVYTEQALAGVKVSCESVSTMTNPKGKFVLNVPDKKKKFYKISFSKKGYMNDHLDSVAANSKNEILIGLMKEMK